MKTNRNLQTAMMAISQLKSEDMKYAIDAIKDRQRELNTIASLAARRTYMIGSEVRVNGSRETWLGSIEKINRTKCVVKNKSTGTLYRVPMSMLKGVA